MAIQSLKSSQRLIWLILIMIGLYLVFFTIFDDQMKSHKTRPTAIHQSGDDIPLRFKMEDRNIGEEPKNSIQDAQNILLSKNQTTMAKEIKSEEKQQFPHYYDDDLHPTWNFNISKMYNNSVMKKWSEPTPVAENSIISGPGENGTAYTVQKEEEKLTEQLKAQYNFNALASDKISLHRSLPDYRFAECQSVKYPIKLPTTSIIIVVHNEIWSMLLRTVWSIIDRSPRTLLEEIILVDDASTYPFLKQPLDEYVRDLPVSVRIIRTEKRQGLIRARLMGARAAKGSVLTFFDAHIEVTEGWLPPLLSRIASDRSVVAVPFIDAINPNDIRYIPRKEVEIIGLRWYLIFYWIKLPERELIRTRNDRTVPVRIPTHVGCAFSIDREYFFEIGSYDEGMDIWGGENIELAFKTWMCGGSMELIPCSRVGHLYRTSTYSFNDDKAMVIRRNNVRVAEVWMDEFKKFYYASNPGTRQMTPGNLTDRINLRKHLQCKSFRWYLENILPESNWLQRYNVMGELVNEEDGKCLDYYEIKLNSLKVLKLIPYSCHKNGGNQFYSYAKSGQIVSVENLCVGIQSDMLILVTCSKNDASQFWDYDDKKKMLVHRQSNLCLGKIENEVKLGPCNAEDKRYKWSFRSENI